MAVQDHAEKAVTTTSEMKARILELQKSIQQEKIELAQLRRDMPPEPVSDYTFKAHDGPDVRLSEMFGEHNDLVLVHNMGKSCPYCTLWADGFNGLTPHLENRAGLVVISKDEPAVQREFYQSRGWTFKMYSSHSSTFNRDMGFEAETGPKDSGLLRSDQRPGVSAFHKNSDGTIVRIATAPFGPGDDFCALWPMLDLLKDGPGDWAPKYSY